MHVYASSSFAALANTVMCVVPMIEACWECVGRVLFALREICTKKAPDRCVDHGALFLVEPVFLVRNGLLLVAVE